MNWYVLYTSSRAEKQVEKNLIADGIEVFLPLHLSPRKWSDRIKMVEVPLFSSYIFVKTDDNTLRNLLKVTGISRIIFFNEQPAIIKDKEIKSIKEFLLKAKGYECEFIENDEVSITLGPLKGIKGLVKKKSREYLYLFIEQIGINVKVKLNQVLRNSSSVLEA